MLGRSIEARDAAAAEGSPRCEVWWAHIEQVRADHRRLLDVHQLRRLQGLVREADRARLMVSAVLTRAVVAAELACAPEAVQFDRTCTTCGQPHGKPAVVGGGGLELSVSHSGSWVAVAVARSAVGVDVEEGQGGLDVTALAAHTLSVEERQQLLRMSAEAQQQGFLRYWTRKEAVLKATGDGLRVPMDSLTVSEPTASAALERWRGRPGMADRVTVVDLDGPAGYPASLAVLDSPNVHVSELDGSPRMRAASALSA